MFKLKKNDPFSVCLVVCDIFFKSFGRLRREWLTLELHEMIKVIHIVACLIVFILFYGRRWQGCIQTYEK